MKLLSWAHKKLPFGHSTDKNPLRAGDFVELRRQNLLNCEQDGSASRDTHAEVLTIGTLGIGNLLSHGYNEEEEEEDDDDDYDEEVEEEEEEDDEEEEEEDQQGRQRQSMSSHRESVSSNRESVSSNRQSMSSNRESVSSVDIQKLQEELQKILYSKPEEAPSISKGGKAAKVRKKEEARYQQRSGGGDNDSNNCKQTKVHGRKPHIPSGERESKRGLLPLKSYLEVPMETLATISCKSKEKGASFTSFKFFNKRHYSLLMQSLKSKFLHSTMPTHVNIPPPLYESLVEPKSKEYMSQHTTTTMDKVLHLLQKVTKRNPNGRQKWSTKQDKKIERLNACTRNNGEEESLNWAIARSHRGSERFINYITNTIAQADKNDYSTISNPQKAWLSNTNGQSGEDGCVLRKLSTSPSNSSSEAWINTDDEYLVLEL